MRATLGAFLVVATLAALAGAAPDAQQVVARMEAALEPAKPSIRRLDFTVSADQDSSRVVVGEARKRVDGKLRILLVTLAPEGLRGTAYLVQEGAGVPNVQWVYLPAIRRVRTVVSPEAYSAFLNSDFTYADLGFVRKAATYTLVGEVKRDGVETYQLQTVPAESWYYGRWVTWVAADSGLPVEREFYDPANVLWKREHWGRPTVVEGIPTVLEISMEDLQAKTRTDIAVTAVDYDVDLPDSLFDPAKLPAAGAATVWAQLDD